MLLLSLIASATSIFFYSPEVSSICISVSTFEFSVLLLVSSFLDICSLSQIFFCEMV